MNNLQQTTEKSEEMLSHLSEEVNSFCFVQPTLLSEAQTRFTTAAQSMFATFQSHMSSLLDEEDDEVAQLTKTITQLRLELEQKKEELESHLERNADSEQHFTDTIAKLEADLNEERQNHDETKVTLAVRDDTIATQNREIQTLKEHHHFQDLLLMLAASDAEKTREENERLTELLEETRCVNNEMFQIMEDYKLLDYAADHLHTDLISEKEKVHDLETQLDAQRSAWVANEAELNAKILDLNAQLDLQTLNLEAKRDAQRSECVKYETKVTAMMTELEDKIRKNTFNLALYKVDNENLKMELQVAQQKIADLEFDKIDLNAKIAELEDPIDYYYRTVEPQGWLEGPYLHAPLEEEECCVYNEDDWKRFNAPDFAPHWELCRGSDLE